MNKKQEKFIRLMNEMTQSSLLKYIGDQNMPSGKKYRMFNSNRDHGQLKKNSTYLCSTLKKKKYLRDEDGMGGLSDGLSIGDIANKHNVSYDEIVKQLIKGVDVEMEHTNDKELSKKIAMDHLVEDPKYYDKLSKIEESVTNKKHVLSKKIHNYTVDIYKITDSIETVFIFSISDGEDVYDSPKIKNKKAKMLYNNIIKYIEMNLTSKEIIDGLEYHLNESKG
jgi:hypothetical protein